MKRTEKANSLHEQGFNCSQSVLTAFSDIVGLSEQECLDISAGFGGGAGTGELCGALSGGIMVLGLMNPVDLEKPVESKKKTASLAEKLQKRFLEKFGAVRCDDLLDKNYIAPAALSNEALKAKSYCGKLIITTVELVEEILQELK